MDHQHPKFPSLTDYLNVGTPPSPPGAGELLRVMQSASPSGSLPSPPEKSGLAKLQECADLGKKLLQNNRLTKDTSLQWVRRVRFAILSIYGKDAGVFQDWDTLVKDVQKQGLALGHFRQHLANVESFMAELAMLSSRPVACSASRTSRVPSTKNVFIIHGHDELNTRRLVQLLQGHFGLNPIAMLAKPGMSRPLTEKFEDEAQTCSFAFALFTPDDEVKNASDAYQQARPNVVYEVGWFVGRLGRPRVTLILKTGTRIHSDLDGVSQIRFSENIEEKFLDIQKELKAAQLIL